MSSTTDAAASSEGDAAAAVHGEYHEDTVQLQDEEVERLKTDKPLRPFLVEKFEKEAKRHWDIFYRNNTVNAYKDRHWLTREFPELLDQPQEGEEFLKVLEVGCGVGNTIFPLLQENRKIFMHACDFSPRAVAFVKSHESYDTSRCHAFECDLTKDQLADNIPAASLDLITCFFVLCAMSPSVMVEALKNFLTVLKPGGKVLIREHGLYDFSQLRFKPGHKLDDNYYLRQDGTRSYFFSTDFLRQLAAEAGFEVETAVYVYRKTENKKEDFQAQRVFMQARIVKPAD